MSNNNFSPVGMCIYCNVKNVKLTDEHILPYSMGGNIVLPKASCEKCQVIINKFENHVASKSYALLRTHLKFPSRSKQFVVDKIPISFKYPNNQDRVIQIPVTEAPIFYIIPYYPLPPFWTDNTLSWKAEPTKISLDATDLLGEKISRKRFRKIKDKYAPSSISRSVTTGDLSVENFSRFIYKIAWGFFCATLPNLPIETDIPEKIISGKFPNYPNFDDMFSSPQSYKHKGYFSVRVFNNNEGGTNFIYCSIKLFVAAGYPEYYCRIGKCDNILIDQIYTDA